MKWSVTTTTFGSEASHLRLAVIVHLLGFLVIMHLGRDVGLSRSRCVRRGLPISNSAGVTVWSGPGSEKGI